MKRLLFASLFVASLHAAVGVEAFVGYSPSSTDLWGNARVKSLSLVGGDVSIGKTFEYVASFSYLTVPGSHIQNYAVTPAGGRLNFFPRHKVHPFLLANGGIVASTRPIPVPRPNATGLNFIVDFGAGLKVSRVSAGYKLMHISNAGTTRFNPGLTLHVFFAAFRIH